MSATDIFQTKREFVRWIRNLSAPKGDVHMRVVVGYDLISWSLKAAVAPQHEVPAWAGAVLPLPISAKQAAEIWDATQEENLCLYFYLEKGFGAIIVAARNGIWKALDERYLPFKKGEFTELSYENAKTMVRDSKVWSALCGEVQMFGVSCRLLHRRDENCDALS